MLSDKKKKNAKDQKVGHCGLFIPAIEKDLRELRRVGYAVVRSGAWSVGVSIGKIGQQSNGRKVQS